MKKNNIRLTESDLRNIVKESVNKVIREGHWNTDVDAEWDSIVGVVGAETMLNELHQYLDSDVIDDFIEHIKNMYDIDNEYYEH